MKNERNFTDYLEDILDSALKISLFIAEMSFDEFTKDDKTVFAVVRGLEIIGEATKNIPSDVREKYPIIPWREMAGMRDKLTHNYFGVNLLVVWKTATQDILALAPMVRQVLLDTEMSE